MPACFTPSRPRHCHPIGQNSKSERFTPTPIGVLHGVRSDQRFAPRRCGGTEPPTSSWGSVFATRNPRGAAGVSLAPVGSSLDITAQADLWTTEPESRQAKAESCTSRPELLPPWVVLTPDSSGAHSMGGFRSPDVDSWEPLRLRSQTRIALAEQGDEVGGAGRFSGDQENPGGVEDCARHHRGLCDIRHILRSRRARLHRILHTPVRATRATVCARRWMQLQPS